MLEQIARETDCISHRIKCDCCGTETLAEIKGDKLVILDKRHGRRHVVVLTLRELLDMMKRTLWWKKKNETLTE